MARLKEIVGKAISGEWGLDDEAGTGIPVLRTTNFTNEGIINFSDVVTRTINKKDLLQKYLRPGDIIIEKSGGSDKQPVGRVVYYDGAPDTYLFNNFTGVLRIINPAQWNSKYLFYALYANYLRGGTRKYQNKTTGLHNLKTDQYVEEFEVDEISLSEQYHVATILDKLRELISLRKQQLAKLDELVKARFVEMFGDQCVNNKHWPIVKLDSLFRISSSKRIYQNEQVQIGIPFLRISDLVQKITSGNVHAELFISIGMYNDLKSKGFVPKPNDILITSRGTLGQCYVVSEQDKFYFQDGMISWLSDMDKNVVTGYITQLFLMDGFRKQIDDVPSGTTVNYLSIERLKTLDVMLPPIELQQRFVELKDKICKNKLTIQQSLDKLEVLKKALMQE